MHKRHHPPSGTNQQDSDRKSAVDTMWRERGEDWSVESWLDASAARRGELGIKPCSSHVRPSEDGRNKKPCLKWLAMPQSQHFEDRLTALRVEKYHSEQIYISTLALRFAAVHVRRYQKSMNIQFARRQTAQANKISMRLITQNSYMLLNIKQISCKLINVLMYVNCSQNMHQHLKA